MCHQPLTMASKPPISSTLNPNAPAFVPASYLAAEDFSPEWWRLIQTCPSFRDYWLKERHATEENEKQAAAAAEADEFDEIDDLLELGIMHIQLNDLEETEEKAPPASRAPPVKQANGNTRDVAKR